MKIQNPKSAIDSILEDDINVQDLTVYPITLARYALLDYIQSPFIHKTEFDMLSVITSLYVMCNDKQVLKVYNTSNIDKLKEDAYEWADDLTPDIISKLTSKVIEKMQLLNKVAPDSMEDKSSKKEDASQQTAG